MINRSVVEPFPGTEILRSRNKMLQDFALVHSPYVGIVEINVLFSIIFLEIYSEVWMSEQGYVVIKLIRLFDCSTPTWCKTFPLCIKQYLVTN